MKETREWLESGNFKKCLSINNLDNSEELRQSSPDSDPGVPNMSNLSRWGVPAPAASALDCSQFISFIYLFIYF